MSFRNCLNKLNHSIIGIIAIYMTYFCNGLNYQGTAMHVFLCTIGYNCLLAEGIMSHYLGNQITRTFSYNAKTVIHVCFQVVGGAMGVTGALLKMYETDIHFQSTHGILGLLATMFTLCAMFNGIATLYSNNYFARERSKKLHNLIGMMAFVCGMTAIYYGYETEFFKNAPPSRIYKEISYCLNLSSSS